MKKINAIVILLAGSVATIAISYMIFTGFTISANFWLLLLLWLIAAVVGIAIADNAIRIDRGIQTNPNLTKIVYVPVIVITFLIFIFNNNFLPFLIALETGSIGMLYIGYLLFRRISP